MLRPVQNLAKNILIWIYIISLGGLDLKFGVKREKEIITEINADLDGACSYGCGYRRTCSFINNSLVNKALGKHLGGAHGGC